MKKISADDSKAYREFVNARDRAAERLHANSQRRQTDYLRACLGEILEYVAARADILDPLNTRSMSDLNLTVQGLFVHLADALTIEVISLRKKTYLLTRASEAEAIGRAKGTLNYYVSDRDVDRIALAASQAGGDLAGRISLYVDRLRSAIIYKIRSSLLQEKPKHELLKDLVSVFPKKKMLPRQPRVLRRLTEAKVGGGLGIPGGEMATGMLDDNLWDAMVEDYKDEYVPKWRDPDTKLGGAKISTAEGDEVYAWELERDTTEEFVNSVRTGQVDAANKLGIVDMMWIAVVDDKTDECCLWRDGLTTTEIEAELPNHDDGCEGITPPIHFNCRCRVAPVLDSILDEVPSNLKDFNEWLAS